MNIVIATNVPFPYGCAYSSRVRSFIKLLSKMGHEIDLIACPDSSNSHVDFILDDNIHYVTMDESLFARAGFGASAPFVDKLNELLTQKNFDLLFSSSLPYCVAAIHKIAKKHNIPYVIEQCEWFDSTSFRLGRLHPYYRAHVRRIESENRKLDGVVAISRLFEEHYSNQGLKVIRIPTILDLAEIECRLDVPKKALPINLAFSGTLGHGKENIEPMLRAVCAINESAERIHLHFYGPNRGELEAALAADDSKALLNSPYVHIHGKIPQEEVEAALRAADFSFIIRPQRRSSNAGFPTKLAESLSVGTPVIANSTGDIGLYLKNGENGFLTDDVSVAGLTALLQDVIDMTLNEREQMRKNARVTAEQAFDYRVYALQMDSFLKDVCNGAG